jgi:hypothetical protein
MPVSEPEKKPERRMRAARTENRRPSGASFKSSVDSGLPSRKYLEEKRKERQPAPLAYSM